MAILTEFPGLEAHVIVNGEALTEYDDDDKRVPLPGHIVKYVECQDGLPFGIKVYYNSDFIWRSQCIDVCYRIDGKSVRGRYYYPHSSDQSIIDGIRYQEEDGTWKFRQFQFGEIKIDEELVQELPKRTSKHVGSITLVFKWADRPNPDPLRDVQFMLPEGIRGISEKQIKGRAVSHQLQLGEAKSIPPGRWSPRTTYPFGDIPFAKVTFRYRSRRALQSLRIIPRSPSPVPLEQRALEELSADELRQLLRSERERWNQRVEIKKEVKREREEEEDLADNDHEASEVTNKDPVESGGRARITAKRLKTEIDLETGVEIIDPS